MFDRALSGTMGQRGERENRMRKYLAVLSTLLLVFGSVPALATTTASNTVIVPITLTIPESVSISTGGVSQISLTNANPQSTLQVTTSWQIKSGHTGAQIFSWFSTLPTGGLNNTPYSAVLFTTAYNGGATVNCGQPAFTGQSFGVAGQNCGSFAFSQNVATDLNDSATVAFTLAVSFPTNQAVGTYGNGVLNLLFEIS